MFESVSLLLILNAVYLEKNFQVSIASYIPIVTLKLINIKGVINMGNK